MRMYECACTMNLEKGVVMSLTATRTITASQRRPLVFRPPQLCDNTNQEQQLAQRGEDAGITIRRGEEERAWTWRQKCKECKEMRSEGCLVLPARINSSIDCLLLLFVYEEQMKETVL